MNTKTEPIEERIELLVDGELPEGARLELFGAIGETPGGWRQCALAYAEAQAIGESLSAENAPEPAAAAAAAAGPRWWRLGSIAAALVGAFFAGRATDAAAGRGAPVEVVQQAQPARAPGVRPALFRNTVAPDGAPAYLTHAELPEFLLQALVSAGHRVRQAERKIHLDSPDGEALELPLVETQIIDMRPVAL